MKKNLVLSVALLTAFIAAALIISKPWITIHHTKPITVKGYAEKEVVSDSGSLTVEVFGTGESNSEAYETAGNALEKVENLIRGILGETLELVELQTSVEGIAQLDENGRKTNFIDFYRATRRLRVNTEDVQGLKQLGRSLYDLNREGIHLSINGPEFFVSNLDEVKLELIESATGNGKQRAELMAKSSGERLGSLISAQQGVIQITKKNSSEVASWGIYDTETIDKVVKLVVTLEFEIGGK